MDTSEPQARRRGFFLHSETTGEPDTGDHESPEGLGVRVRTARTSRMQVSRLGSGGRSRPEHDGEDSRPQIRSGSVTGSRQRAHLPR